MIHMIMMKNMKNFPDYDMDFGYQFYEDDKLINDKTRKLEVTRFAKFLYEFRNLTFAYFVNLCTHQCEFT